MPVNKSQNEDINSCIYALIQLSGHSPKTVCTFSFTLFKLMLVCSD